MCAISWPMAVVSTSAEDSASSDSGRITLFPAVTGPEIRGENNSSTPVRPIAPCQRRHTDDMPVAGGGVAHQPAGERRHRRRERNLPKGIEQKGKQKAANCFHVVPPAEAPAAFESARAFPGSSAWFPSDSARDCRLNLQKSGRLCRRPLA